MEVRSIAMRTFALESHFRYNKIVTTKRLLMLKWILYIAAIIIIGVGGAVLYKWAHRND